MAAPNGTRGNSSSAALHRLATLLIWQRMLRLQTYVPGVDLQLLDPQPVPRLRRPRTIGIYYQQEFALEAGGVDGIAFYHELTGRLRSVRGCGMLRSLYWYTRRYRDVHTCHRRAAVPHAKQVWYDVDRDDPAFAKLHGTEFRPAFQRSGRSKGRWATVPPTWIAPPTWEYNYLTLGSTLRWPFDRRRPLVLVSNKFTSEWAHPPTNFISVAELERLAGMVVAAGGTLVYNRVSGSKLKGVKEDGQKPYELGDKAMLRRRIAAPRSAWAGRVFLMEDLLESLGAEVASAGYNALQLALIGLAGCTVAVQGGNSWLAAKAGGHMVIFHQRGTEVNQAYRYTFPLLGMAQAITVTRERDGVADELGRFLHAGRCVRHPPDQPSAWGASEELAAAWATPPADALERVLRANGLYYRQLQRVPENNLKGPAGPTMRWNASAIGYYT